MSETIVDDGRYFEVEDTVVDVDGQSFATGLWIPHEPDEPENLLMASDVAGAVRDIKDVAEVLDNPNRTPAEVRFPPKKWTRSQGAVGSCAGYAGAWTLARCRVMAGMDFVPLSGESLYSQTNGGRDRGSGLVNNIKAMVSTGVAPEGLNQPGRFYTERSLPEAAKAERHRFKADEWYQVRTELELAIAAALGFIIGVACHVGGGWRRYDGDVLIGNNGPGNHATLVDDVRIRKGILEFRMPNSHGLNWGIDGVIWVRWDRTFSGPIRNHVFYAMRSAKSDPKATNPPKVIA